MYYLLCGTSAQAIVDCLLIISYIIQKKAELKMVEYILAQIPENKAWKPSFSMINNPILIKLWLIFLRFILVYLKSFSFSYLQSSLSVVKLYEIWFSLYGAYDWFSLSLSLSLSLSSSSISVCILSFIVSNGWLKNPDANPAKMPAINFQS